MRNVKNLALFVLMLALVSTAAVADIHYVNPGESIQAAIVAADPGDEIEVAPGTYLEAIDFIGKAVRLYSSGGPDVTTIDGNGYYHVVQCTRWEGPGTILEGFTITGANSSYEFGGGMYNSSGSPTVTNCTFTGNTATEGGGMYNWDNSSPTVTNCTFTGNTAQIYGGGMYNYYNCSPTVTNCTFTGNTAGEKGGGMYNYYYSSPTVTNCTFSGNTAGRYGGGMYNYWDSSPTVTNCILWDDSPYEIFDDVSSSTTVTYSDVQGGWAGTGNIDADPMFADAEGRLLAFSPCLDAGNDAAVPPGVTTDLDGNPRIQGACVDMGAFESDLNYMDPGWVFMIPDAPDFGYSLNEADLLYFYSFDFVQSFNLDTGVWSIYRPIGLVYIDWPFYY
jgi:parallel beta-helix repeat protein